MFLGHFYQKYETKLYLGEAVNGLYLALKESSRIEDEKAFSKLTLFLRKKIYKSYFQSSFSAYKELVILPARLYPNLNQKFRNNFIDFLAISFRETAFGSFSIIKNLEEAQYNTQLKLIELNYWGCVQLLKEMIALKDFSNFIKIMEELNQNTSRIYDSFPKNNVSEQTVSNVNFIHSSIYFILISWLIYLFENQKLTKNDLEGFDLQNSLTGKLNFYNSIDFFKFFIRIRKETFNHFLEVDNWEIEEPKMGVAYFALSSRTWLNYGFTFLLIKDNRFRLFHNLQNFVDVDNNSYSFIGSEIEPIIEVFENDFDERWGELLFPNITVANRQNIFKQNKTTALETLAELKKVGELNYYKSINKQSLSKVKVAEFVNQVGEKWSQTNLIPAILKEYNCVEFKENDKEKDGFGFFQLFTKMKSMFTDEGNRFVYGVTDIGSQLASEIEKQFYNKLFKNKEVIYVNDLKVKLDNLIESFPKDSELVIFISWRGLDLLNQNQEIEYLYDSQEKFISAKYKGIPIVRQALVFPDTLLLIDLRKTIKFILYQDKDWYNKELLVEVSELSEELVEEELGKYDTKWKVNDGYEVSEEEAKLLIKSSILIKVILKYDLIILNNDSYYFLKY